MRALPKTPRKKSPLKKRPGSTAGKCKFCRLCGRSRTGHPREGCPFVQPSSSTQAGPSREHSAGSRVTVRRRFADVHAVSFATPGASRSSSPSPSQEATSDTDVSMEPRLLDASETSSQLAHSVPQQNAPSEQHPSFTLQVLPDPEPTDHLRQSAEGTDKHQLRVHFAFVSSTRAATLSETAAEILESRHGLSAEKQGHNKIIHWQSSIEDLPEVDPLEEARSKQRMPGMFRLPSPEPTITPSHFNMFHTLQRPAQGLKPEESFDFLRNMVSMSVLEDATLVKIKIDDLADIQVMAEMMDLHLQSFSADVESDLWLAMGKDEAAVALLAETFQNAIEEDKCRYVMLGAVDGAVIIGAIAKWTVG